MKKLIPIFILLAVGVYACTGGEEKVKVPEDVIPPSEMIGLMVDVHLAEAAIHQQQQKGADVPALTLTCYRSVMEKHGLQPGDFTKSMEFYSHHPRLLRQIYEQVVSELSTRQSMPGVNTQRGF